jgi:hypothetical protein
MAHDRKGRATHLGDNVICLSLGCLKALRACVFVAALRQLV